MIWTKFSEKIPPPCVLWVSDYHTVWLDTDMWAREPKIGRWWGDVEVWSAADIKYPEVPLETPNREYVSIQ